MGTISEKFILREDSSAGELARFLRERVDSSFESLRIFWLDVASFRRPVRLRMAERLARALRDFPPEKRLKILVSGINSADWRAGETAYWTASQLQLTSGELSELAELVLKQSNPFVQASGFDFIRRVGRALPLQLWFGPAVRLLSRLREEALRRNRHLRLHSPFQLEELGGHSHRSSGDKGHPVELHNSLCGEREDWSAHVRAAIVRLLGEAGPLSRETAAALWESLKDPSPPVRNLARGGLRFSVRVRKNRAIFNFLLEKVRLEADDNYPAVQWLARLLSPEQFSQLLSAEFSSWPESSRYAVLKVLPQFFKNLSIKNKEIIYKICNLFYKASSDFRVNFLRSVASGGRNALFCLYRLWKGGKIGRGEFSEAIIALFRADPPSSWPGEYGGVLRDSLAGLFSGGASPEVVLRVALYCPRRCGVDRELLLRALRALPSGARVLWSARMWGGFEELRSELQEFIVSSSRENPEILEQLFRIIARDFRGRGSLFKLAISLVDWRGDSRIPPSLVAVLRRNSDFQMYLYRELTARIRAIANLEKSGKSEKIELYRYLELFSSAPVRGVGRGVEKFWGREFIPALLGVLGRAEKWGLKPLLLEALGSVELREPPGDLKISREVLKRLFFGGGVGGERLLGRKLGLLCRIFSPFGGEGVLVYRGMRSGSSSVKLEAIRAAYRCWKNFRRTVLPPKHLFRLLRRLSSNRDVRVAMVARRISALLKNGE